VAEAEIKPAYLISGTDEAKIARLGRGCELAPSARVGGALELFEAERPAAPTPRRCSPRWPRSR
jgi:hypothetical protein